MCQTIRIHYADYTIIATGIQFLNSSWRCELVILKYNEALYSACTFTPHATCEEAEQSGITLAVLIVDDEVSGLNR